MWILNVDTWMILMWILFFNLFSQSCLILTVGPPSFFSNTSSSQRPGMDLRAASGTRTVKSHGVGLIHGGFHGFFLWRILWKWMFFHGNFGKKNSWVDVFVCSYFCCFPHGKSTAEFFHCGICVINWVLLKPTGYLRHITMAMAILSLYSLAVCYGKWVVCRWITC